MLKPSIKNLMLMSYSAPFLYKNIKSSLGFIHKTLMYLETVKMFFPPTDSFRMAILT